MANPENNTDSRALKARPLLACFPLYPPVELFHSMNLTPVTLWGLEGSVKKTPIADQHIPPGACSVARRLAEYVLSDKGADFAGVFSMNGCHTLRNVPEILGHALAEQGRTLAFLHMRIPAASAGEPFAADYLRQEIRNLIGNLETAYETPFDPEAFARSVALYRRARELAAECDTLAAQGRAPFAVLSTVLMTSHWMGVDMAVQQLEALKTQAQNSEIVRFSTPVLLSGILPPPPGLWLPLMQAGLHIVGNDIAALGRSWFAHPNAPGHTSPEDYYVAFYEQHTPCPTLPHTADQWPDTLVRLARERGARGVIFLNEKFCEYGHMESPHLENRLKQQGIQSLRLEFSAQDTNFASHTARLQAFAEMIGA